LDRYRDSAENTWIYRGVRDEYQGHNKMTNLPLIEMGKKLDQVMRFIIDRDIFEMITDENTEDCPAMREWLIREILATDAMKEARIVDLLSVLRLKEECFHSKD